MKEKTCEFKCSIFEKEKENKRAYFFKERMLRVGLIPFVYG